MNLDKLLAPLASAHPCGEDLSFSTEFDQIAEMRREDDPTLAQGEWITALKVADWPGVAAHCIDLLTHRTKDLRLAQWLTESWSMSEGYPGLRQGLQLCTTLCEQHWTSLHPQAENGDMEQRIGNITWFLHRLVHIVPTLPLAQSRHGARFTLKDWRQAQHQARHAQTPEHTGTTTVTPTLEQFMRALRDTPKAQLGTTIEALHDSTTQLLAWQALLDQHLGQDGPSFVSLKDTLALACHEADQLVREIGGLPSAKEVSTSDLPPQETPPDTARSSDCLGAITTRAQALQQLREVAAFFRRTEPHSPVAYLADKAVKWGDMPLHEWLRHVIKDQGAMAHLDELLGTAPEPVEAGPY